LKKTFAETKSAIAEMEKVFAEPISAFSKTKKAFAEPVSATSKMILEDGFGAKNVKKPGFLRAAGAGLRANSNGTCLK
jgi:hypothetical protein